MRKISQLILFLLCALPIAAQIPSGYVQTTATVPSLANGTFGAAWTNLSSSPQLALLGCVSTFQQTVNGNFDANGHFSVQLADTAQICPAPSTWTFTLTYSCPKPPNTAFMVQVPVTGGGGTEDISAQIIAALPASPCGGSTPTFPITIPEGGTGATTAAGAAFNITNDLYCSPTESAASCYASACSIASTDNAVTVHFPSGNFSIPTPIALCSGVKTQGVVPRLVDCAANLSSCESPNGGTWFFPTTSAFNTPGGGTSGVNNVSFEDVGFADWTGTAITFGSATTVGMNSGYFHNVYFYGSPTQNQSDKAVVCYNCQIVPMDNVTAINVNTLVSELQAGATGSIPGNALLTGLTIQTYPKSSANGNCSEPGLDMESNLMTLIRPQVNTYGGDVPGCSDAIYINTTGIGIEDADLEGFFLNAIHIGSAGGDVKASLAFCFGTPDTVNDFTVEAGSAANHLTSVCPFATVNIKGSPGNISQTSSWFEGNYYSTFPWQSLYAIGGSGMTTGSYALSFSGGGCTTQPTGEIFVTGPTAYGQPELLTPGIGCTSSPTVTAATGGTPPTITANFSTPAYGIFNGQANLSGGLSLTGNISAGSTVGGVNLFGNYIDHAIGNGLQIDSFFPAYLNLCQQSDSQCATFIYDFFGGYSTSTGGYGGGLNVSMGPAGSGAHGGVWFRNDSGNVVATLVDKRQGISGLGTFDTTHVFYLPTPGFGWWNGTNAALFAMPTFTTTLTWTMPDFSGTVLNTGYLASLTNCTTAAFAYVPADSQCEAIGGGGGSGTVTSVALTVPAWLTVGGSPITTSGTLAVTATGSQTANEFLATPNGSTGAVGLRSIVAADVPTLNQNTTGTASNLSGTPTLPNGTAATTQTVGDNTTDVATDAFVLANAGSGCANALTLNNSGSGALSGTTFNCGAAVTASYNTIGAAPALGNNVPETTSWTLANNNVYRFTGSGASNATTPASVSSLAIASIWNQGSAAVTVVTGGPTLVCVPSTCIVPIGAAASITTDGTNFDVQISNALGSAFGSAANANTGTSGATVPLLNGANTWGALQTFGTNISIGGVTATGATGTGNVVFSISPALTGTPDASGATQFKLPVAASFATLANGELGYDSTNKNWHAWGNAADNFVALLLASGTYTNGHCAQLSNVSSVLTLVDAGSACGSDSGGGTSGWSGTPITFISSTTQYAPPVGGSLTSTTESVADVASPVAQTISNLSVSLSAALGASATLQVTFRDGGVSEPLTCTTASGGTNCVDSTHSFNVAKGDLIDFQLVSSGTVTAGVPQIVITYAAGTSSVGVTSIATTGPITGGPITTTGTIACATCVVASSPAAGVAHFAGSTQTVTSSAVALGDITTIGANTTLANVTGSTAVPTAASIPAGLQFYTSGTGYSAATSANLLGVCTTCVTSASSLTSGALMTGAGSQGSQTITTGTGVTTALGVATGSAGAFGVLIATGTAAMGTSAIASGACATVVTVTATGAATTDALEVGFNGDPTAVTGYGASATGAVLTIYPYPTSGNVNIKVCNSTAASITPGALTLNWKVYR